MNRANGEIQVTTGRRPTLGYTTIRLAVLLGAFLLVAVNPFVNFYLHNNFVQGWYQSIGIGALWFVSPLEGLESLLITKAIYMPSIIGMAVPFTLAFLLHRSQLKVEYITCTEVQSEGDEATSGITFTSSKIRTCITAQRTAADIDACSTSRVRRAKSQLHTQLLGEVVIGNDNTALNKNLLYRLVQLCDQRANFTQILFCFTNQK